MTEQQAYSELQIAARVLSDAAKQLSGADPGCEGYKAICRICAGLASLLLVPQLWADEVPETAKFMGRMAADRLPKLERLKATTNQRGRHPGLWP